MLIYEDIQERERYAEDCSQEIPNRQIHYVQIGNDLHLGVGRYRVDD